MQPLPAFIDLRALADDLAGKSEYRRLRSALDGAGKAQSCAADLALAQTHCDALTQMLPSPRRRGTLTRQATEGALLQLAVILYERATQAASSRGERGSIKIRDHLTPEQRRDHDALVRIRQRALAHVYPNEVVNEQVWQYDVMLAVEQGLAWQPVAATKRVQFNLATFQRLERLLPDVYAMMIARFHKHLAKAMQIMNDSPLPQALFDKHRIDPVTVLGSRENVTAAIEGRVSGHASFLGD